MRSKSFQALTTDIKQRKGVAPELANTLFLGTPGAAIAAITSMQDYKIESSLDAHRHAPDAHMYWIPGNMMLNATSGIAPIS